MYGAILGDIIGSPFEFDRGEKKKEFKLFSPGANFTDDSVMTVAVCDAILQAGPEANPYLIRENAIESMKGWGLKYPDAGYGARFSWWLHADPEPYNSFGNGSAMRVSSVGWLYDSMERTREVACAVTDVSHNHPEGIKGAESVASAIFLARTGSSKEQIREYVVKEFGYDFGRTLDEIRPKYYHVESCQETVPEAFTAFFEGNNFEDVIRNAVSLGGDCDTLTCIAGSIAEAYYGVPATLKRECLNRIPEDMKEVILKFDEIRGLCAAENGRGSIFWESGL